MNLFGKTGKEMTNNVETKKTPSISVVIPVWNGAKTLETTIVSCLNQTLQPIEILVCDDGSTDESSEIVKIIQNPRVVWVSGNHSGTPGIPRNRGAEQARGEWIAFCDSDDEWLPEKLEKQILEVEKQKCRASCTNALVKKDNITTNQKVSNWKKKKLSFKNLLNTNNIICSSTMIHSSIYKEIGGFSDIVEYGAFADYIYWLRVATKTDFAFVNEPLVIYDDHPETSLRSSFTDGRLLKEKTLRNFIDWAKINKLHFFIFQTRISILKGWVKKSLSDMIKLCFKR